MERQLLQIQIPDNIYPARGRKLTELCDRQVKLVLEFPTIFTPQGDGNTNNIKPRRIERSDIPDNIYPARGRKHWHRHNLIVIVKIKFPTIFTPQGDGNRCCITTQSSCFQLIPDNIYPARGRKHCKSGSKSKPASLSFPTIFTPQGDGNLFRSRIKLTLYILYSRQYLPRKGTETKAFPV